MWIIVVGNPVDGFEYHGPFNHEDNAIQWADNYIEDEEWWLSHLTAPVRLAT